MSRSRTWNSSWRLDLAYSRSELTEIHVGDEVGDHVQDVLGAEVVGHLVELHLLLLEQLLGGGSGDQGDVVRGEIVKLVDNLDHFERLRTRSRLSLGRRNCCEFF